MIAFNLISIRARLRALPPMSGPVSAPDDTGLMASAPEDWKGIAVPTERPQLALVPKGETR